jgi:hypothetical protein
MKFKITKKASTRSLIGKWDTYSNKVTAIYCHSDGYPDGVGKLLLDYYQNDLEVTELLNLGNISSLAPEIGEKHPFGENREEWVCAYHRDRGEPLEFVSKNEDYDKFVQVAKDYEWIYLFIEGKWFYGAGNQIQEKGLASLETYSFATPEQIRAQHEEFLKILKEVQQSHQKIRDTLEEENLKKPLLQDDKDFLKGLGISAKLKFIFLK